jgi:hypothetical protein
VMEGAGMGHIGSRKLGILLLACVPLAVVRLLRGCATAGARGGGGGGGGTRAGPPRMPPAPRRLPGGVDALSRAD